MFFKDATTLTLDFDCFCLAKCAEWVSASKQRNQPNMVGFAVFLVLNLSLYFISFKEF